MHEALRQPTQLTQQEHQATLGDGEIRELAEVALRSSLQQFQDEENPTIIRGFGD